MSDLIIKIGDEALDLKVDETIAITKQAAKVGDFATVLADGTNEVTVPLTPKNQQIMDNAHLITSDSEKPYGRLDATLIQEGYETLQDGYAIIKTSSDNFSLQVVGGNASFFNRIKDLDLRSLELSDYDHFWTNQEVFDNRNNTEGLIYTVFEQSLDAYTMNTYGTNQYAVETELLFSSFYIKTLFEKIFDEQGYTFVTDLVSEDIYDKAVIFRAKDHNRGSDMSHHECTVTSDFLDNPTTMLFDSAVVTGTSEYVSNAEFQTRLETPTKRFTFTDSCRCSIDFSINIRSTVTTPFSTTMRIDVLTTSPSGVITQSTETIPIDVGYFDDINTYELSIRVDVTDYDGDVYFQVLPVFAYNLGFFMSSGTSYRVYDLELLSNSSITTSFPYNYITGNTPVLDMKQGDFLKEMAKVYQWVFDTDERTRTVTAKRFDEIKDNIPNAIDLSDKIDANDIKINYGIEGFAQTNAFRYKEDDVSKYDSAGYINVDDTTLKPEKDYVKMSQLAATSQKTRFDTVQSPYVPIFDESAPTNGLSDRIFLVRRVTFPYNINFARVGETPANHPTDDVTFAYFEEAGNDDSLDGLNIVRRFYQSIVDINSRGKTVEARVNLKIKDVQNYDPFLPVYISHLGNYFYWEKLGNYVKDKLTKCVFIKI